MNGITFEVTMADKQHFLTIIFIKTDKFNFHVNWIRLSDSSFWLRFVSFRMMMRPNDEFVAVRLANHRTRLCPARVSSRIMRDSRTVWKSSVKMYVLNCISCAWQQSINFHMICLSRKSARKMHGHWHWSITWPSWWVNITSHWKIFNLSAHRWMPHRKSMAYA